jgi:hypothetical protein
MGLNFAIDELYATGWTALNTAGCEYDADGRAYPNLDRIAREFAEHGFEFTIRHVQIFDCHRAEWRDAQASANAGGVVGGVVGQTPIEAAVFALSRFRRTLAMA